MLIDPKHFSAPLFKKAQMTVRSLRSAGHVAFMVGGCVRDMLYRRDIEEFDIATSATPEEIRQLFPRTVAVGESFGVMIVLEEDNSFEVATFRKDLRYKDGRHPESVLYGADEREDVERRDFTINGLLMDPESKEIIDYVGGRQDLKNQIVRTIGDPEKRFGEDRLRMMRAVRFAAYMDFEIEARTFETIKENSQFIKEVSAERIRDELVKILTRANSGRGLALLRETGILTHVLPEVEAMTGVEQPPEFHPEGDVFIHTRISLEKLEENVPYRSDELTIGMLLHDVGKPPTFEISDRIRFNSHDTVGASIAERICRRLRFSNKQVERISELVRHHMKFQYVFAMRKSTLKKFMAMPHFDEHLALHLADCLASHEKTDAYDFVKLKLKEFGTGEIKPAPLITGHDLIAMGFEPGPLFSEILTAVEIEQLESRLVNKEAAVEFVKGKYSIS